MGRSNTNVTDPYVEVETHVEEKTTGHIATTRTVKDNLNPVWDEKFEIALCHEIDSIVFKVKDKDIVTDDNIGTVTIPAEEIAKGEKIENWFKIEGKRVDNGSIRLSMHYIPFEKLESSFEV